MLEAADRVNKLPNGKINYHWMRKKHSFPRKILSLFFFYCSPELLILEKTSSR